jgi:hypothetical protein
MLPTSDVSDHGNVNESKNTKINYDDDDDNNNNNNNNSQYVL